MNDHRPVDTHALLEGLRAALPDELRAGGHGVLFSGSLYDGLGNASSDVDVYLLRRGCSARNPDRTNRTYLVDGRDQQVNFFSFRTVARIVDTLRRCDTLPLSNFEVLLTYRLRVGELVQGTPWLRRAQRAMQGERADAYFVRWQISRALDVLRDLHGCALSGDHATAAVNARRLIDCAIDVACARRGDVCPVDKWRYRKAARTLGPSPTGRRWFARYRRLQVSFCDHGAAAVARYVARSRALATAVCLEAAAPSPGRLASLQRAALASWALPVSFRGRVFLLDTSGQAYEGSLS